MGISIPGKSKPVEMSDAISLGAPNFTWGEALHGGSRIPKDWKITSNIIKLAEFLQKLRTEEFDGKPMIITSWLRTPYRNGSFHYKGLAVDFVVPGLSPGQVYEKLDKRSDVFNQGLGRYDGHCHIDLRGYRSRWRGKSQ